MSPRAAEIVILTKDPRPGRVKTRLAAAVGAEAAASLHRALAAHTVRWALEAGAPVRVALDGDLDGVFALSLQAAGASVSAQHGGSLGDRLRLAWGGARRTLFLGTDCPTASADWLREALGAPDPVALGPSEDGGYWTITIEAADPLAWAARAAALFDGVPWSTPAVYAETSARCAAAGLPVHTLPLCYDIDELYDLQRLAADPRCPPALQGPVAAALRGGAPLDPTAG